MTSSDEVDDSDAGLAAERTDLAWNRSGLALVVCVAVLVRHLWPLRGTDEVVALAVISAGTFVWATALHLGGRLSRRVRARRGVYDSTVLALISAGTLMLAVAGIVVSLLPNPP